MSRGRRVSIRDVAAAVGVSSTTVSHVLNDVQNARVAEETRLVVSEPLGDLAGAWNEVPESSYGLVHHGHDELHPFRPRP